MRRARRRVLAWLREREERFVWQHQTDHPGPPGPGTGWSASAGPFGAR